MLQSKQSEENVRSGDEGQEVTTLAESELGHNRNQVTDRATIHCETMIGLRSVGET